MNGWMDKWKSDYKQRKEHFFSVILLTLQVEKFSGNKEGVKIHCQNTTSIMDIYFI
jgi:hypothetical protein